MLFWEDMITLISMLEVLLFLLCQYELLFCIHLDLNIHATMKKITLLIMLGNIPHQKFLFYHLPTRGRAEIKLGDAWYISNTSIIFDCSMLYYLLFWTLLGFITLLYYFWDYPIDLEPSASSCFFPCFSVSKKSNIKQSPNGMKPSGKLFLNESNPGDLECM